MCCQIFVDRLGFVLVDAGVVKNAGSLEWLFFVFALVNSLYSFVWDIAMDWAFAPEMGFAMGAFAAATAYVPRLTLRQEAHFLSLAQRLRVVPFFVCTTSMPCRSFNALLRA